MSKEFKIGLLGAGKTGQYVEKINPDVIVFNSKNKLTVESGKNLDCIISFVTGEIFLEYIPVLIEAKLHCVTGSTGVELPDDLEQKLKVNNLKWVWANNFSLGINIVKIMLEKFSLMSELHPEGTFNIHDIHHTKKLDSPSGTALSMKDWLIAGNKKTLNQSNVTITSERTGDIVGIHDCTFYCHEEEISLKHTAHNRGIFAKGALWSADIIKNKNDLESGLHHFSNLIEKYVNL